MQECLNASERYPFHAMLEGRGMVVSDCDEQLIINFKFHQPVKIHSLWLRGPGEKGPKTVKLFINNPVPLGFDRAQSSPAVQEVEFSKEGSAGATDGSNEVCLRQMNYVRFQNVKSLQLFILDNHGGGEQTVVEELKLFGTPLAATNMQDFKRVGLDRGTAVHLCYSLLDFRWRARPARQGTRGKGTRQARQRGREGRSTRAYTADDTLLMRLLNANLPLWPS